MAKCSLIAGIAGKCQSSRWVNLIYNRAESHSFGANTCKLQVGSGKLQVATSYLLVCFLFRFFLSCPSASVCGAWEYWNAVESQDR